MEEINRQRKREREKREEKKCEKNRWREKGKQSCESFAAALKYFTRVNLKLIKTQNYEAISNGMKLSELKVRVNESYVHIKKWKGAGGSGYAYTQKCICKGCFEIEIIKKNCLYGYDFCRFTT